MEENPKPSRRWYRFSLRTMLVLVTLVAVVLGSLAYPIHWIRARRTFVAAHAGCEIDATWVNVHDSSYTAPTPWILYLLGEHGVAAWEIHCLSWDERKEAKRLFPEAEFLDHPKPSPLPPPP
jgi:hypothetical protein